MIVVLVILWFGDSDVNIVGRWFLSCLGQESIDVSSSASEDFVLFWYVTSVAWQIVLVVWDEGLGGHFFITYKLNYNF